MHYVSLILSAERNRRVLHTFRCFFTSRRAESAISTRTKRASTLASAFETNRLFSLASSSRRRRLLEPRLRRRLHLRVLYPVHCTDPQRRPQLREVIIADTNLGNSRMESATPRLCPRGG